MQYLIWEAALFDYLSSPRAPCFKNEKLHSLAEAEVDVAKRASDPAQFAVCLKETDTLIGLFLRTIATNQTATPGQ